jgi:hypothetical protein
MSTGKRAWPTFSGCLPLAIRPGGASGLEPGWYALVLNC